MAADRESTNPLTCPLVTAFVLAVLGMACAVIAAPAASAAESGDRITSYDIAATVRADGSMAVTERFTYRLAIGRSSPIQWAIPLRYSQIGGDGQEDPLKSRLLSIEDLSVSMDGEPVRVFSDRQTWWYSAWIGRGGVTPAGTHTYEVKYVVRGLATAGNGVPNLWWNAILDHNEPVDRVRLSLTAPATPGKVSCSVSNNAAPCDASASGTTARFGVSDLPAKSSVTAYAELPGVATTTGVASRPGTIPTLRSNLELPGERVGLPAAVVYAVALLLSVLAVVGVVLLRRARVRDWVRLRDGGALIAITGLVVAYLLAAYDLMWWAVPVVGFGLALIGLHRRLVQSL
ncbi:DUF2207 domain-containing protein [Actinopolymorpha alba]|uniref:DUF2207 domain-containing protein n=1 Tax=Actinopolymorpha alba TaxID=533267 RepID=UPI00035FF3A9|nr:DUF2207 domain-containing protein [Actinopolymorpha alba]